MCIHFLASFDLGYMVLVSTACLLIITVLHHRTADYHNQPELVKVAAVGNHILLG